MNQTMTLDEKLAISNKACLLWQDGDKEGGYWVAPYPCWSSSILIKYIGYGRT